MSDNDQLPMIDAGKFIDYVWSMRQERDQLRAEVEALRKDADRYLWLRDKSESVHGLYLSTPIWMTGVRFRQEDVDRTIDAAMAKEGSANES